MVGNVVKTVDVKSGKGTLTVFASNLSTGQYSYALVANGKVLQSRKMEKVR